MPTLSYDGQSLILDGRRVWLVSGAIHYPRVPRELWRSRIRAAKQAGLNCIETYVFWNVHEPRPGVFNFQGDADLRHFVELIAQEGMFCILRPGPYICSEWDFGGLPVWLHRTEGVALRQASPPFLEACARYLGAVLDQVRDLQVTVPAGNGQPAGTTGSGAGVPGSGLAAIAPGSAGPIIMMQAENEWFCHNPEQARAYLDELVRYLRENGCAVPISVCNNLWQRVEGTIDTWNANQHLAADLRQLRVVQPRAPRIVSEYWTGWFDQWGKEHHRAADAAFNSYRLAQILACGAQYNLYMFHGGTNFGFFGGRTVASPDCSMTTSYDYDAPLLEAGGRGEKYLAVKRISTFASQFGTLLANLDPSRQHAAVAVNDTAHPLSVIYQTGPQGDVIFLLKSKDDRTQNADLMLPNGLTLPVPLGDARVAWVVLNANLGGVATLDYTNLRPWAFVGRRLLVLFGPAGAQGLLAINRAALTVTVPAAGAPPLIQPHENLTLVVLNEEQVDAAYLTPTGLAVGAAGLDLDDRPVPHADWPSARLVQIDGTTRDLPLKPARRPAAPRLGKWEPAPLTELVTGQSDRFAPIAGPSSLETLSCDYGYGWYRVTMKPGGGASGGGGRGGKLLAPQSGDRLHVFTKGKLAEVLGLGPGAVDEPTSLSLGNEVTILADNLGRFNFGWRMGEKKGLFGHVYAVKPLALGKPKITPERSPNPFVLGGYFTGLRVGAQRPADSLSWVVKPPRGAKEPLVLDIGGFPFRAMVLLNNHPVGLYDPGYTAGIGRWVLDTAAGLKSGKNHLKLALFDRFDATKRAGPGTRPQNPLSFVRLYQTVANLTAKAQWAFTPWTLPAASDFGPPTRASGGGGGGSGGSGGSGGGQPCWFRTQFTVNHTDVPLWLEPRGMSKGQLYLNGHNLGRYWVATAAGKPVPPQRLYYLPEPWLKVGEPNELWLFDEHGKSPAGCQLVYDAMGPYGK